LVLAVDESDVLLARITTRPPRDVRDVSLESWSNIGLPKPSTVRLTKLVTVDRRLVLRRVGALGSEDRRTVLKVLAHWVQELETDFAG